MASVTKPFTPLRAVGRGHGQGHAQRLKLPLPEHFGRGVESQNHPRLLALGQQLFAQAVQGRRPTPPPTSSGNCEAVTSSSRSTSKPLPRPVKGPAPCPPRLVAHGLGAQTHHLVDQIQRAFLAGPPVAYRDRASEVKSPAAAPCTNCPGRTMARVSPERRIWYTFWVSGSWLSITKRIGPPPLLSRWWRCTA